MPFDPDEQNFDLTIILAEEKARILKDESKVLNSDAVFTRYWEMIPVAAMKASKETIWTRRIELNPIVDQKPMIGVYRIQNVSFKFDNRKDTGCVYETLAKGLLTQLAELSPYASNPIAYNSSTGPDKDVRLVSYKALPQTDTYYADPTQIPPTQDQINNDNCFQQLIRIWPYVDPNYVESIVQTLKAIKYVVNPVASNYNNPTNMPDIYPGTWKVLDVTTTANDDGSVGITQVLQQNILNYVERYTKDFSEDITLTYKEGLSLDELNAFLATIYQWPYPTTDGVTRNVTLYNGFGIPFNTPYPMAGQTNEISITLEKTTGLYSIFVRTSSAYTLTFGPFTTTDVEGSKLTLKREHACLQILLADIATYCTATSGTATDNRIRGRQEPNGLFEYELSSEVRYSNNITVWPETISGYLHEEPVHSGNFYAYLVCKKYFAGAGNSHAANIYAGIPHSASVNVLSDTGGIDPRIDDVTTYGDWYVVHGATQLKSKGNIIISALRVEKSTKIFSL